MSPRRRPTQILRETSTPIEKLEERVLLAARTVSAHRVASRLPVLYVQLAPVHQRTSTRRGGAAATPPVTSVPVSAPVATTTVTPPVATTTAATTTTTVAAPAEPLAYPIVVPSSAQPQINSPGTSWLTPSKMRSAYGIDQVLFGNVQGDGTGQTIAIIDAYHYPTALADLQAFDAQFGLPDPPSLKIVNQVGALNNLPPVDPHGPGNGSWEQEEALDLQWTHAIAPMANLILVEATSNAYSNLITAAAGWAATQAGVVAVSMSFGGSEFSTESTYDAALTTPVGHAGVTFLASTGDAGKPGSYPAYSPNVVSVGGTQLTLNGSAYSTETGWSGSGGGISQYATQPTYQNGVVSSQSTTQRTTPDVSMDASPSSGVAVYDSYDNSTSPWIQVGGTSLATPMWAALIAIADQGRMLAGLPALNGKTETLPRLYALPSSDFHDVIGGSNGFTAVAGYDLVTGRGTPIANTLIKHLAGVGSISGTVFVDNNSNGVRDAGEAPIAGATVYVDANNNGILDTGAAKTFTASTNLPLAIPDNSATGASSTISVSGLGNLVTDVNLTFSITHPRDQDLTATLIGPDGTQVTLFPQINSTGPNFTNTTLDDSISMSILAGFAPFTGSFHPTGLLSALNGKSANGTWKLKIADRTANNVGSITGWSLSIATSPEIAAISDSDGKYVLNSVPTGTSLVRQLIPAGYMQTSPGAGGSPQTPNTVTVAEDISGQSFGNFPTLITPVADDDVFTISVDPSQTYLQINDSGSASPAVAYQLPLSQLPDLTLNLTGSHNIVNVDYTNWPTISANKLKIIGLSGGSDELHITGAAPDQQFTLSDSQLGSAFGSTINFQNIANVSLYTCSVSYTGSLSAFELYVAPDASFVWN